MIKLIIPRIPVSLNDLLAMHWTERRTEKMIWEQEIFIFCWQNKIKLIKGQVKVTLVYFFPDNRLRDYDNYSGKNVLDGLKKHVIEEDNSRIVTSLTLAFDYDKDNPRLEILIEKVGK